MKKLILIGMIALFCSLNAYSQYCGGREYEIRLKAPGGESAPPANAKYEFYFVFPPGESKSEVDHYEASDFAAKFYYGSNRGKPYRFWQGKKGIELMPVKKKRAEKYIAAYKESDYADLSKGLLEWTKNKIRGEFDNGELKVRTSETDDTPILLKIDAPDFETLYFFGGLFGGCFAPDHEIEMIRRKNFEGKSKK